MNHRISIKATASLALLLTITPFAHSAEITPPGTFIEENGVVVIEMESATLPQDWVKITDFENYLGDGYIQYTGKRYGKEPGGETIRYPIQINRAGTYQFCWRSRNGPEAEAGDQANDSWLTIESDEYFSTRAEKKRSHNGEFLKVHANALDGWEWKPDGLKGKTALFATFQNPGLYHIVVSGRSNGHSIDRMALWHSSVSEDNVKAITTAPSRQQK